MLGLGFLIYYLLRKNKIYASRIVVVTTLTINPIVMLVINREPLLATISMLCIFFNEVIKI